METGCVAMKTVDPMTTTDESVKVYEKPVCMEMEPDVCEFSTKKPSKIDMAAKKIIAGGTGVALAAPQIGKVSVKFSNWVANGITQVANDFGKTIEKMPKSVPASVKYLTMLLGATATFLLASKDSDKDGKLDILESVGKLFKPGMSA